MPEPADWTAMVYLAGDNDLSPAGDADLVQMRRVGSTPRLNLLAQLDNAGDHGTQRIRVGRNGQSEETFELGETDSGSPDVLVDFVRWARERYPARRYFLVLWNHGGGWEPAEIERVARAVRSPGFSPREAPMRSASRLRRAFFRPTLERLLAASPHQRAICSDDGSGHSLDTVELGKALARIVEVLGQPIDLLGMDACLMSNLEVAYQAAPYARVLVASEETEPADGWPYDTVLAGLEARPELSATELGAHIVEAYIDSYAGDEQAGDLTQTALDLSQLGSLVRPLDALVEALVAEMPADGSWVWTAQRRAPKFWDGTLRDLASLCRGLESKGDRVDPAARALLDALTPGAGRAVIASRNRGEKVKDCGGVSIYLPSEGHISEYYGEVAFAKGTQWLRFLQAYNQV